MLTEEEFSVWKDKMTEARRGRSRSALFHVALLLNYENLKDMDPHEICAKFGFTPTHYTEVRKIFKAMQLLRSLGYEVVPIAEEKVL